MRWGQLPGGGAAGVEQGVEQGIANSSDAITTYARSGAGQAISSAVSGGTLASLADIQALPTVKSGLQRVSFLVTAPTTNQELLTGFGSIAYGIWRILVTASVATATVRLEDQDLNYIWIHDRIVAVGSSFSLSSDSEYLWRSQLGGGVNLVKDANSTVNVEIWFDYLFS